MSITDKEFLPGDFDQKKEEVLFNKLTTARVKNFEQCQRKLWYQVRQTESSYERKEDVVSLFRELVSSKVKKMALPPEERKGKLNFGSLSDVIEGYTIPTQKKARNLARYFGVRRFFEKKDRLLGTDVWVEASLPNKFLAKGKIPIAIEKSDVFMGDYVNVILPELSFKINTETTADVIFLAYLAWENYKKPVAVTRVSPNTVETATFWFMPEDEILDGEDADIMSVESLPDIITGISAEMKKTAESHETPFPRASAKCFRCPFLDKCWEACSSEIKKFSPDELRARMILAQQIQKQAQKQLLEHYKASGEEIIELYDGSMIFFKSSVSYTLQSDDIEGRVTKKKILEELDGNELEELKGIDAVTVDTKNDLARKKLKKIMSQKGINIEFKPKVTTNISITEPKPKPKKEDEEGKGESSD